MPSRKTCLHSLFLFFFFLILTAGALLAATGEDRTFSEQELRHLAQMPQLSREALADGSWFQDFEAYCKDQFPQRERCMEAYYSFLDLMQVNERNGYVRGKNNQILNVRGYCLPSDSTGYADGGYGTAQTNALQKMASVAEEYGGNVIYMNIPYRMEFYADLYPDFYNSRKEMDQTQRSTIISKATEAGIRVVETYELLQSHREEFIYFTTDHHWTVRGAYYGYQALLECINSLDPALQLRYPDFSQLQRTARQERMVGSYLRTWGDGGTICNDYMEYAIPADMPSYTRYESGEPSNLPLLDTQINGYTAFMSGDYANTLVDTGRDELPSILFVGFSYTNPLEFMSVYNFDTVESLDPRLYAGSICDYIRQSRPDYIVVVKDDIYEGNYEFSCTVE